MKLAKQISTLFLTLSLSITLSHAQTLRGTVRDADNGEPVVGASVQLRFSSGGAAAVSLATSPSGEFVFEQIRVGYYRLEISAQGFENQILAEVNVAAGKEQVLEISLRRSASQLAEVTITAVQPGRRAPLPLGEIPLTRDQTLRFPATFFDPARLAMAYPGVANTDDQANGLSIRGNSPASVRWRLEGVDIVNPNHLPNAGTFSDRPAAASGGVLMFSAQLLDNSSLLTGSYPAGYGDAVGGIMDMNLRKGNNRQHEFTAQAGLIGLDLAAEGPLNGRRWRVEGGRPDSNPQPSTVHRPPSSYLVNYRYSTVGLLGQLGVSFGDEQINFQDLSFKLNFEGKRGGQWSVFGLGGLSTNTFQHKTDSAEVKLYKDFFDIDFESRTGVLGVSNWSPVWKNAWLKTTVAVSGQASERVSASATFSERGSRDELDETKLSGSLTLSQRLARGFGIMAGAMVTKQIFTAKSIENSFAHEIVNHDISLIQPWANVYWKSLNQNSIINLGLHNVFYYLEKGQEYRYKFEPRLNFSQRFAKDYQLVFSTGFYSQTPPLWLSKYEFSTMSSLKHSVACVWHFAPNWSLKVEAYKQTFTDILSRSGFSILNLSEYQPYKFFDAFPLGKGRNCGIEFSVNHHLSDGWFLLANTTIGKSKYSKPESSIVGGTKWLSTRWDIGHIANIVFGKEWQREKRPGKERTIGLNSRVVWTGGAREADFNFSQSQALHTTIIDESNGYYRQYPDYFRIDLRVYWRKNLGNRRNSTFALDIQNLTNRLNFAYHFYDAYTNQIETKYQLGTIPNFSWRLEF